MSVKIPQVSYSNTMPQLWQEKARSVGFLGGNTPVNPFIPPQPSTDQFHNSQNIELRTKAPKLPERNTKTLTALGVIPFIRRDLSVPEKLESDNKLGAAMQIGVGLINFPGDLREVKNAAVEIAGTLKHLDNPTELKNIFKIKGQHEMTLFRGTFIESLSSKYPIFQKIRNYDKPLYHTKLGKWAQQKFNLSIDYAKTDFIMGKVYKDPITNKIVFPKNMFTPTYKFNGNYLQRLGGRMLHRLSKLGLAANVVYEIPALIASITKTKGSAIDKAKALSKQLIKSTAFVGLSTVGIAIGGAILAPYSLTLGLVGMAIGSAMSISASNNLNKKVDKFFA